MIRELQGYQAEVDVYDPCVLPEDAKAHYDITLLSEPRKNTYDAVILAVAHSQFVDMGITQIRSLTKENSVIYDVKYLLPADQVDGRL